MSNGLNNTRPLFVDLDGTLVSTNTLLESCLLFIKRYPFKFWRLIVWLYYGKAYFKAQLAKQVIPNAELLPYQDVVDSYLKKEKESGRDIYLLTAANQAIAENISDHKKIFTRAIGSNSTVNLKKLNKLKEIQKICGTKQFDYIGNSFADVTIWKAAHTAILAKNSKIVIQELNKNNKKAIVILNKKKRSFKSWIKALRLHQWSKNLLLFLALFMSHRILELNLLKQVFIAFFSFSFSASAIYILNDLFDLEFDRRHPSKKHRPFASGKLSIGPGMLAMLILFSVSFILAFVLLPKIFTIVLAIYLITTTSYSLILKEKLFIDVFILGLLYTLRVLAGGLSAGIEVSLWLLGFSGFFFLSLAFMKRYTDLVLLKNNNQVEMFGRGYSLDNINIVQKTGIISGIISLIILSFYINSEQVNQLYVQPLLILLTIPILLFWLMRMWFIAHGGKMTDDPIIFAIKDKISYISLFLIVTILFIATFIH